MNEYPHLAHSYLQLTRKAKEWDKVKEHVLPRLVDGIIQSPLQGQWIATNLIFNQEHGTIPSAVSVKSFASLWRKKVGFFVELTNGSFVYRRELSDGNDLALLLRHKFESVWKLRVEVLPSNISLSNEADLANVANNAVAEHCLQPHLNERGMECLREKMKMLFENPLSPIAKLPSPVKISSSATSYHGSKKTRNISRSDAAIGRLQSSNQQFQLFTAMSGNLQSAIFQKLLKYYNTGSGHHEEELHLTAHNTLQFFVDHGVSFSSDDFVKRFLKKKLKRGSIARQLFPKSDGLATLSEGDITRVTSVITDITKQVAESFLPNTDDASQLLKMMIKSHRFVNAVLPGGKVDKKAEFKQNPVVKKIRSALSGKIKITQDERETLVSLLIETYPQSWIRQYLGLGRKTTLAAKDRAIAFGAGCPIPDLAKKKIRRPGRRKGEREDWTMEWFNSTENTVCSPCIKRDAATGKLINTADRFRRRNRHAGWKKYEKDAKRANIQPYSQRYFYNLNKEMRLKDSKSDAALCPSCHRYGTENYQKIRLVIDFIYAPTDPTHAKYHALVDKFQCYFNRDGAFYHSLTQTNECLDWCLHFQLSDPFEDSLQESCCDHLHIKRDATVLEKNTFFHDLIEDAYTKSSQVNATVEVEVPMKGMCKGKILWLRHGNTKIIFESGEHIMKRWEDLAEQLSCTEFNILCLPEYVYRLQESHQRFIRHLYLDRNQTYGELMTLKNNDHVALMDYCMKLRAKAWKSDTSKFHMLMNKGCSVHVYCLKGRINTADVATSLGVAKGDYKMLWIDSFCSNTTQGAYETLCVLEESTKKAKELMPSMEKLAFISDAGSGYKTTQSILAVRDFQNITKCQVTHWHFNASGEGKRSETDGHNHHIKIRREQAMQAGSPPQCMTAAHEVEAQNFDGGIEGAFPVLLEFDYENEAPMKKKAWTGIQGYHDFKFYVDGSIRVWRSYGIGNGLLFTKKELDKYYESPQVGKGVIAENASNPLSEGGSPSTQKEHLSFPQKSTCAKFVTCIKNESDWVAKVELSEKRKRNEKRQHEKRKKQKLDAKEKEKKKFQEDVNEKLGKEIFCIKSDEHGTSEHQIDTTNDFEIFEPPDTTEQSSEEISKIPMGGGLLLHRGSNVLDKGIKSFIRREIQKGNEASGNRQSIPEILETIRPHVPSFLLPDLNEIQTAVKTILHEKMIKKETKEKSKSIQEVQGMVEYDESIGNATKRERVVNNEREKRQHDAGTLSRAQNARKYLPNHRNLFLAKYINICLIDEEAKTRVISDVRYDNCLKKSAWTVVATMSRKHHFDDRVQIIHTDNVGDTITIPVGTSLSRYIKRYNEFYREL